MVLLSRVGSIVLQLFLYIIIQESFGVVNFHPCVPNIFLHGQNILSKHFMH